MRENEHIHALPYATPWIYLETKLADVVPLELGEEGRSVGALKPTAVPGRLLNLQRAQPITGSRFLRMTDRRDHQS